MTKLRCSLGPTSHPIPGNGRWLGVLRMIAFVPICRHGLGSRSHSHVLCGTLQFLTRGSEAMHIGATGGKRDDGSHTAELHAANFARNHSQD